MNRALDNGTIRAAWWSVLALLLVLVGSAFAEGSINFAPSGSTAFRPFLETGYNGGVTGGVPRKTTLYAYARQGEMIALGSSAHGVGVGTIKYTSPDGTSATCALPTTANGNAGRILNRAQEVAGPNAGTVTTGYAPCWVAVDTPAKQGIWTVEFTSPTSTSASNPPMTSAGSELPDPTLASMASTVAAWDITVHNGSNVRQTGRVFANYFALNVGNNGGTNGLAVDLPVYAQTFDGYQYRLTQQIDPFGYIFFANSKGALDSSNLPVYYSGCEPSTGFGSPVEAGCTPLVRFASPAAPDDPARGLYTHKLFLNLPDQTLPGTAPIANIPNSPFVSGSTWLLPTSPTVPQPPTNLTFMGREGQPNSAGSLPDGTLGGYFVFNNPDPTRAYAYRLEIKLSANGLGSTDRVLSGTATPGSNSVLWDGRDGNGNIVPAGSFQYTATVKLYAGEVHFPFIDVENARGLLVDRLTLPAGTSDPGSAPGIVYYDDSRINRTGAPTQLSALGGVDARTTPRHGFTSSFGDKRFIDTWAYYPSSPAALGTPFVIREADVEIVKTTGFTTVSAGSVLSYRLTVTNRSATIDALGVTVKDTFDANLTGVSWRCRPNVGAATCAAASGTGNIDTKVDLRAGTSVVFDIVATVSPTFTGAATTATLTNTATASRGLDASDPALANNTSTVNLTVSSLPGISGFVFDDANGNGAFDAGEAGLSGVTVVVRTDATTTCRAVSTDANGLYVFAALGAGSYTVYEAAGTSASNPPCPPTPADPGGYTSTVNTRSVTLGGTANNQNFADTVVSGSSATITGTVYVDADHDASRATTESGLGGVTVSLTNSTGTTVTTTTSPNGGYTFTGLAAGNYTVTQTLPGGYVGTTAVSVPVMLPAGRTLTVDFGDYQGAKVSGSVFQDVGYGTSGGGIGLAHDALRGASEIGLNGLTVQAVTLNAQGQATQIHDSTLTDADGRYTVYVPAGLTSAAVRQIPPGAYVATGTSVSGANAILATGAFDPVASRRVLTPVAPSTVLNGAVFGAVDFGLVPPINLARNDARSTTSPGSVVYQHTLTPGTFGPISLVITGKFAYRVYLDLNGNTQVDASDQLVSPGSAISVDASWPRNPDGTPRPRSLLVVVNVPAGLPAGAFDSGVVTAVQTFQNTTVVTRQVGVLDVTTVGGVTGQLQLLKQVRNCGTAGVSCATVFSPSVVSARTNEVLEYCISYQNLGTTDVTGMIMSDPVPPFTTVESNVTDYGSRAIRLNSTYLTGASDADAGELTSSLLTVRAGTVTPGAGGQVCYRVRVR